MLEKAMLLVYGLNETKMDCSIKSKICLKIGQSVWMKRNNAKHFFTREKSYWHFVFGANISLPFVKRTSANVSDSSFKSSYLVSRYQYCMWYKRISEIYVIRVTFFESIFIFDCLWMRVFLCFSNTWRVLSYTIYSWIEHESYKCLRWLRRKIKSEGEV